jgi:hypothetical protein
MKKILKSVVKTLAIVGIAFALYVLAHKLGTMERGYEAVGGEIFVPLLVIFAGKIWGMIKAPFKAIKEI